MALRILIKIVATVLVTMPGLAYHGLEVQLPLGVSLSEPSQLNEGRNTNIQVRELVTFGADLVYNYDGWGGGIRFDSISSFKTTKIETLEVGTRLFSLLARYHWELAGLYFGPIAAASVYHNSDVSILRPSASFEKFRAQDVSHVSAGVQLQWLKDIYVLGGEFGYQVLELSAFAESNGARLTTPSGADTVVNLGGPYMKALIGLRF